MPQDLLQGFSGRVGGCLAGVFCAYLMLCFSPTVVPLRETLVRLHHESSMAYFLSIISPRAPRPEPADETPAADLALSSASRSSSSRPLQRPRSSSRSREDATLPPPRPAVLPPLQNALLTATLVGLALGVAALLPNASAQIFALTGATGVCCIGYIFPIYSCASPPSLRASPAARTAARARHRSRPPSLTPTTAHGQHHPPPHYRPPLHGVRCSRQLGPASAARRRYWTHHRVPWPSTVLALNLH